MARNTVCLITGPSASGKTTLQKDLVNMGWGKPVNFTTREPRSDDELDEYVFIDESTFATKMSMGDFSEMTNYAGNLYAMTRHFDQDRKLAIIVDPVGKAALEAFFTKEGRRYFTVWIDCDEDTRLQRLLERGTSVKGIKERLSDAEWMKKVNPTYDLTLDGTLNHMELASEVTLYEATLK